MGRNESDIARQKQEFEQWRTEETKRIEHNRKKLHNQKRQIEKERMQLAVEKNSFANQQKFEEGLLDMKRRVLETELYKLAEEKKLFEQKKSFYDRVNTHQKEELLKIPSEVHGSMFFAGVDSQSALKKRYKDLLKIYHPDNKCGDTNTIQEISREYKRLLDKMQEKE